MPPATPATLPPADRAALGVVLVGLGAIAAWGAWWPGVLLVGALAASAHAAARRQPVLSDRWAGGLWLAWGVFALRGLLAALGAAWLWPWLLVLAGAWLLWRGAASPRNTDWPVA